MKKLSEEHKKNIENGVLKYWDKKGRKGTIVKSGYRAVWGFARRKYEHRTIVEQQIGRDLLTEEHVHHKDGNKLNNSIDNLEIISKADHARNHAIDRNLGKDRKGVPPVNKKDKETIKKIIQLRLEDNTLASISDKTNISVTTIIKYLKENNINNKQSRWKKIN